MRAPVSFSLQEIIAQMQKVMKNVLVNVDEVVFMWDMLQFIPYF
jgi:hypothetical protein